MVMLDIADIGHCRSNTQFSNQLLHRKLAELYSGYLIALAQQPADVECLSTKRQEYTRTIGKLQCAHVSLQKPVYPTVVKRNLITIPALEPEIPVQVLAPLRRWPRPLLVRSGAIPAATR